MQAALDIYFDEIRQKRPEFEAAITTWRDRLAPRLKEMETERKAVIKRAITRTVTAAVIVATALAIIAILTRGAVIFPFGIFFGIIAIVIASAVVWVPVFSMKSQTKQLVVGAACECFGFRYETLHPDVSAISDWRSLGSWIKSQSTSGSFTSFASVKTPPTPAFDRLKDAKLLPSHDTSKFEDLIEGKRAEADFTMVECKLTEKQGSGKNRRTVTKFQGILFNIDYPDRFYGRTLIARDGWWSWGRTDGMDKVALVSKELEDAFTVYSTDQVEARTLLTPDRMERLIALERHFKGGKLRGVFEDGHVTIALEAGDQFEAGSVFKPLVDPDRFIETLTEIGLVCDMIDGFLTRDWYKDKI
ncbi:DUF3137 domain-containing protein [Henriciella aquimarina]|uniref:DUF3137 domain-containing protein n=1 Tax=Henriciella aquimarina TaxID=545261 RepID=UPI0009FF5134|nr:DUF3137 domain-containing protein [Henriciella aquimarina]